MVGQAPLSRLAPDCGPAWSLGFSSTLSIGTAFPVRLGLSFSLDSRIACLIELPVAATTIGADVVPGKKKCFTPTTR